MTAADRIASFFESFGPSDVERLAAWYAVDASFKDPFNDVRGLAAIQAVYRDMFDKLGAPRFVVTTRTQQGNDCWLAWEFSFRLKSGKGELVVVHGASHLALDASGRIEVHRDYWDAAEELYEKVPLLGSLMRWLKRRIAAPS